MGIQSQKTGYIKKKKIESLTKIWQKVAKHFGENCDWINDWTVCDYSLMLQTAHHHCQYHSIVQWGKIKILIYCLLTKNTRVHYLQVHAVYGFRKKMEFWLPTPSLVFNFYVDLSKNYGSIRIQIFKRLIFLSVVGRCVKTLGAATTIPYTVEPRILVDKTTPSTTPPSINRYDEESYQEETHKSCRRKEGVILYSIVSTFRTSFFSCCSIVQVPFVATIP